MGETVKTSIMNMFNQTRNRAARERAAEYATRCDFEKIFTEDMTTLHLLAFLLTADQAKAERCFVAGLEESTQGNPVFRQWARSWSKRAIIRNAIKIMAPAPGQPSPASVSPDMPKESPERDALIASVTELEPLQRFVFVMSVLEGYSVNECATLLSCTVQEVAQARSFALGRIATAPTPAYKISSAPLLAQAQTRTT